MTFDPASVEVTCVTLPKDYCVQVAFEYINVCGYSDQFCKKYHLLHIHIHTYTYRMSDHIREDAYSRTGGIFIRDTVRDTACSLWINELWPNQGQIIPRIIPRLPRCSKIWRMILGRMHTLKCKISVVNHFKNPIEAMAMEEKCLPQITLT